MENKILLVAHGGAIAPQGGTATLKLETTAIEEALALVADTAAFLRGGCRAVQWLVVTSGFDLNGDIWDETLREVYRALKSLEENDEGFKFSYSKEKRKQGTAIIFVRLVVPRKDDGTDALEDHLRKDNAFRGSFGS